MLGIGFWSSWLPSSVRVSYSNSRLFVAPFGLAIWYRVPFWSFWWGAWVSYRFLFALWSLMAVLVISGLLSSLRQLHFFFVPSLKVFSNFFLFYFVFVWFVISSLFGVFTLSAHIFVFPTGFFRISIFVFYTSVKLILSYGCSQFAFLTCVSKSFHSSLLIMVHFSIKACVLWLHTLMLITTVLWSGPLSFSSLFGSCLINQLLYVLRFLLWFC